MLTRRYTVALMLGAALMTGRCTAQEGLNQPARENFAHRPDAQGSGTQQEQKPDTKSTSSQTSVQATHRGTVQRIETSAGTGLYKVRDLPAHWFLGAYVPTDRNLQ